MATVVNIKKMLDAAVHFGHQTRRWNPKMKPYIFTARNRIHIIDLKKTLVELDRAYSFAEKMASRGGSMLFVGTKKQAQEPIATNAQRCNMPYVNNRWLGGMLTNFVTIRERVRRMEELEAMDTDGRMAALPKKEQILLRKELGKLQANLNGVREMTEIPDALFVVDTKREEIAIEEAQRLGIPVIGILDTNADPDEVDYGIPANDDAIRSVNLMCEVIADAIIAGAGGSLNESDFADADPSAQAAATSQGDASVAGAAGEDGATADGAPDAFAAEEPAESGEQASAIARDVAAAIAAELALDEPEAGTGLADTIAQESTDAANEADEA
jgi:small subunit ribosomal protein S2